MKIILVRHAKVLYPSDKPILASQMQAWVEGYNFACIDESCPEDRDLFSLLDESDVILSSTLRRSIDSLAVLNRVPDSKEDIFDEAEVPFIGIKWIKLSARKWLTIARVLSLLGCCHYGKIFQVTKKRALQAIDVLLAYAKEDKTVFLLGHGGMNWLLSQELKQRGWIEEKKAGHGNWDYGIYSYKRRVDV